MNELEELKKLLGKAVYRGIPTAVSLSNAELIDRLITDANGDTSDEAEVSNLLNDILEMQRALEHKLNGGSDSTLTTLDSVRFDSVQSTPDLVDATDPSSAITIDPEYFDQVKKDLGIRNPMYRIDQVEYIKNTNEVLVQLKKADGAVNEFKKIVNSGIVQNWGV